MRTDPLATLLADGAVPVIDGGMGTQLEAQGADLSDALWSARLLRDDPEAIVAAHLAFLRAGARVATTASYQATFQGFAARGIGHDDAAALLRRSVELASVARDRHRAERAADAGLDPRPVLVAASVGPYGAMLADGSEFRGRYGLTPAALADFHRERVEVLAGSGADLLACETVPEVEEAVALASVLDDIGAPAWLSFQCADGARIASGAPIEEAVAAADASAAVVAIGVNCTTPALIPELVARAAAVTDKPILAYPNGGDRWDAAARRWEPGPAGSAVDPEAARRWVAAGARIVGGCCRVTPAAIAALAGSDLRPA